MHIHFLDPYRPLKSAIHDVDPRVKLVLTVAFIFTCSLTPTAAWPAYILLLAIVVSLEVLSGLGIGYVLKRSALALPFVLAALPIVFSMPGHTLFSLPLGPWRPSASLEGIERFVSLALKSWLSVQAAILLASSTPFPDLLLAMRAVHVPKLLVAIFGLMWRYLFVLGDEALRLMRARAARSGRPAGSGPGPGGTILWRARVAGGMTGSLLMRGLERSERIYVSMLSRGYDGETRALPLAPMTTRSWSILAASLIPLVLLLLFAILVLR